jgi:glycosyltransferase involved in cell wall biosynthesis
MNPLLSIIIPTYNRAHLIGETLESIVNQTYTNWECIVVDDGSTDNTELILNEFIKKDSRFSYYKRPESRKKGANSCRNYGFEVSKGDWIKWFDSDDILFPNAFEASSIYFSELSQMIVSSLQYVDFDKKKLKYEHNLISKNTIEDYLVGKMKFYTFTPTWSRIFLENQVELFDVTITNLDDWDFNLRMLYQNPSIVYINEPLIQYRVHESSLSHEINKLNFSEIQSEFRAIEKHLVLIRNNKKENRKILENYYKNRLRYFLRAMLVTNHQKKYYLLKKNVQTIFGFTIYTVFKKGYRFL